MSDLVLTYFDDIIDQHAIGHNFLREEFAGYYPYYFWGIDCFGFGRGSAYLINRMGFQAIFKNRIIQQMKRNFVKTNRRKFIWSLTNDTWLYDEFIEYRYETFPYSVEDYKKKPKQQWMDIFEKSNLSSPRTRQALFTSGERLLPVIINILAM